MKMKSVSDLRQSYIGKPLLRKNLDHDVYTQFDNWFSEAVEAGIPEPNAMTLATVNRAVRPTARIVLFKGLSSRGGFSFYTNYNSEKGNDLHANPFAALLFSWIPIARQIRIEGRVTKLSREESEAYFQSRPRGSQIGAWASNQSEVISNREDLIQKHRAFEEQFSDQEVIPTPGHWGGFELIPDRIEFWQGNENRLHDRFVYEKKDSDWLIERLAP